MGRPICPADIKLKELKTQMEQMPHITEKLKADIDDYFEMFR